LSPPPRKDEARTRRYVFATIAFLCLSLILGQIFLHQTSVGSPKFVRGTFLLWTVTVLVILALLILATVLGRNLIKLYFERKSGRVGSKFKTRMVTVSVILSLLPALLLFFLAYGLINFSIEQWFSAPAEQMLENSKAITEQYYEETEQRSRHAVASVASSMESEELISPERRGRLEARLSQLRQQHLLDGLRVFDPRGNLAAEAGTRALGFKTSPALTGLVLRAIHGASEFQVQRVSPDDALREAVWATAPIFGRGGKIIGAVLAESLIPRSVRFKSVSVMEAYEKYRLLQREKSALRFTVVMMLALSTLLIVFAFLWFAMYLAKRITVPIQALAEGAAAVAGGNLGYRVECEAFDELDNLVEAFNRMTAELQENKSNIEAAQNNLRQTNVELDNRRRYIETILQTIATAVISLDANYRVRTMNRAAVQMLQVEGPVEGLRLEDVVKGGACETLRMLLHKSSVLGRAVRDIELALYGKTLHLATTVTPLVDSEGQPTGWVLVLDDVTELLRAERMAAWQEVARRLAHEIKNPLTPIQLSAERILRRYRQIFAQHEALSPAHRQIETASFEKLLDECIQTITHEAGSLKRLVDEFSRFARLPAARLEEVDVHRILENALNLYNGRIQDVRIVRVFSPDIPLVRLDPEQMKRVFINLFDNALEAMAGNSNAKVLQIRTCRKTEESCVHIEISDTGRGFPQEYQDSLFLPYFSTRKDGTGLGLAIVRQIITEHHGHVRAEANLPLGTRILIDLPLVPS